MKPALKYTLEVVGLAALFAAFFVLVDVAAHRRGKSNDRAQVGLAKPPSPAASSGILWSTNTGYTLVQTNGGYLWVSNGSFVSATVNTSAPPCDVDRSSRDYRLGWEDGWVAYSIDAFAVDRFHAAADAMPDDGDPVALAILWAKCVDEARRSQALHDGLPCEWKLAFTNSPFWSRDVGAPRRISRGQRSRFIQSTGAATNAESATLTNVSIIEWRRPGGGGP